MQSDSNEREKGLSLYYSSSEYNSLKNTYSKQKGEHITVDDLLSQLDKVSDQHKKNDIYCSLETIIVCGTPSELAAINYEVFFNSLILSLQIPAYEWEWLTNDDVTKHSEFYYPSIRSLGVLLQYIPDSTLAISNGTLKDLLSSISYHIHPSLPWTCSKNANIIHRILENLRKSESFDDALEKLFNCELKASLLVLSSKHESSQRDKSLRNPRLTAAGYASTVLKKKNQNRKSALRPLLGFSGVNQEIDESDQRRLWKMSSNVKVLSMIYLMIYFSSDFNVIKDNWAFITSFILNVLDDHDPLIKAQGCYILHYLIHFWGGNGGSYSLLLKTGLYDLFKSSIGVCLTYLPNLTPLDQSIFILKLAYPTYYSLLELEKDKELKLLNYLDMINSHILTSISHVFNTKSYTSLYQLVTYLFEQLQIVIRDYMRAFVLTCYDRIHKLIYQILINLDIQESGPEGVRFLTVVLATQQTIFKTLKDTGNDEAMQCIFPYRYELLASWSITYKFLSSTDPSSTVVCSKESCRSSFLLFKSMYINSVENLNALQHDTQILISYHYILRDLFS